ncbi:MAG: FkbM family methyltransferase [Actinomycetota bacterium]|nr:FkbM family methyltransferase [Actinomycetota bacterium]
MRRQLRQLRHEVTGRARYWGTRAFSRLPDERRRAWGQRVHGRNGQVAVGALTEWYGRAPIGIAAGPAARMAISTAHLPLDHAHIGSIVRGTLEPPVVEAMVRTVRPGHVFYDVGANIGYFTLVAARLVGPAGRVIAFEPVPWCVDAVAANIALNDLRQAEVRAEAVGDASGRAQLLVVGEASQSMLASLHRRADTRERIDVDVVALDDLVSTGAIPPPDVLKIDTEGAEVLVLEGMRETIASHRPRIICEIHDTNAAFAALMDEIGYRAANLGGPWTVTEAGPHIHVLAEPRDA